MTKRIPPILPKQPTKSIPPSHQSHAAAMRETIESIAIAFVLAFLFRTFEAEAFVIPTGSMAPTLMGRHKDLECPKCHNNFQVSSSEEVDRNGGPQKNLPIVDRCTCPMCRYVWDGKDGPVAQTSYNGDRILVNKFAYEFDDPKRWDVIVFKFPQKAQENYIKRLIGLPGDTVRVDHGDIFIEKAESSNFEIARKPPEKLRVMLQPVFNNDLMPAIEKQGWPVRWKADPPSGGNSTGGWTSTDHATYEIDGAAAGENWLYYQHLVPSTAQWSQNLRDVPQSADPVRAQLITDFTAYNTGGWEDDFRRHYDPSGKHWVGDLAIECQADVANDSGQIVLELVKGGRTFQCRLDVGSGKADLSIVDFDKAKFNPQFETAVHGPGKYILMFANCDRQLYLWVNGRVAQVKDYPDLHNDMPQPADLQPVSIGSAGVKMKLSHLNIFRDIYYIAMKRGEELHDYNQVPPLLSSGNFEEFFSDPGQWKYLDRSNMKFATFPLGKDEFFAMGDNSAKSADSRIWGNIPRELLIGKAFFVYWPHPWNRIPGTSIPFPFFPNFARMGFVR
jgi:signal peptidase I